MLHNSSNSVCHQTVLFICKTRCWRRKWKMLFLFLSFLASLRGIHCFLVEGQEFIGSLCWSKVVHQHSWKDKDSPPSLAFSSSPYSTSLCPDLPVCLNQTRPLGHSWGNPVQERVNVLTPFSNPPNIPLLPTIAPPRFLCFPLFLYRLLQMSVYHPFSAFFPPFTQFSSLYSVHSVTLCFFVHFPSSFCLRPGLVFSWVQARLMSVSE